MAAVGARAIADRAAPHESLRRAVTVMGVGVLAAHIGWSLFLSDATGTSGAPTRYPRDMARIAALVPPDTSSALEHTTALRVHGHLQSFQWCSPETPTLVRTAFAAGRSVYAVFLLDDDNGCPEDSARLRATLTVEELPRLPSGARMIRLTPAPRSE